MSCIESMQDSHVNAPTDKAWRRIRALDSPKSFKERVMAVAPASPVACNDPRLTVSITSS